MRKSNVIARGNVVGQLPCSANALRSFMRGVYVMTGIQNVLGLATSSPPHPTSHSKPLTTGRSRLPSPVGPTCPCRVPSPAQSAPSPYPLPSAEYPCRPVPESSSCSWSRRTSSVCCSENSSADRPAQVVAASSARVESETLGCTKRSCFGLM